MKNYSLLKLSNKYSTTKPECLYEKVSLDILHILAHHPDVKCKMMLKKYEKSMKKQVLKVVYSKSSHGIGRRYATNGLSLQFVPTMLWLEKFIMIWIS